MLEAIRRVRVFFPELDGICLKVGLTRAAAGFASREDDWIWINPRQLTYHTIAHELVHLLQNHEHVPRGEKSADLFALARHRTLVDDLPCYLAAPTSLKRAWRIRRTEIESLLHRTARDAAMQRGEGCRTYLRWFERELAERWEPQRDGAFLESEHPADPEERSEPIGHPRLWSAEDARRGR